MIATLGATGGLLRDGVGDFLVLHELPELERLLSGLLQCPALVYRLTTAAPEKRPGARVHGAMHVEIGNLVELVVAVEKSVFQRDELVPKFAQLRPCARHQHRIERIVRRGVRCRGRQLQTAQQNKRQSAGCRFFCTS